MKVSPYILPGLKYPCILTTPIEETIAKVCDFYDITEEEIKGKNRKRELVQARQICMTAIYHIHGWTLLRVGKLFDRDHTTVIHSIQMVKDLSTTNESYRNDVKKLFPSMIQTIQTKRDYKRR